MEESIFQLQDQLFVLTDVLIKANWLAVDSCVESEQQSDWTLRDVFFCIAVVFTKTEPDSSLVVT